MYVRNEHDITRRVGDSAFIGDRFGTRRLMEVLRIYSAVHRILYSLHFYILKTSPSAPPPKGHSSRPVIFGPYLLWPNSCMDQDATWYGGRPRPRRLCVRWGPRSPSQTGERGPHLTRLVHSNIAILTQPFTVKQKHVSTSVYEQSQPDLEAGYIRDNMADVGDSDARKIVVCRAGCLQAMDLIGLTE